MIGWLSEALTDRPNSSFRTCTPSGSLLKSLSTNVSTSYFYFD